MSSEIAKSENGQNRPTEVAVFSRKTRKSRIFAFCKVGLKGRNLTENQNYGKLFFEKFIILVICAQRFQLKFCKV